MGAAAIALGATVAGGLLQAQGVKEEARAQAQQARYRAQVAANNTVLAEQAAQDAIARGKSESNRSQLLTRQEVGDFRASAAARGVVVDEGSALEISEDIRVAGLEDAAAIRDNAGREALAARQQAQDFDQQRRLENAAAQDASRSGRIGIVSSLLNTGSSVSSRWYSFTKAGAA